MLGKLLKYELKSTSRLMGVLYLAVLIVAAIVDSLPEELSGRRHRGMQLQL